MPLDNLSWLPVDLDTREGWYICQIDYSIHYELKIFPYSEVIHWSTTFKLTKVKEKWSTIKFDVFVLSFIFFVPMSQIISFISLSQGRIQRFWKGGMLYVGHHGWPARKILGFRWSKKAEIALETKAFGEAFVSVFSNFLHFYI